MGEATHVCDQSDELVLDVEVVEVDAAAGVEAELDSVEDDVVDDVDVLEELLDEPPDRLSVL
jgi:hypothetical protein